MEFVASLFLEQRRVLFAMEKILVDSLSRLTFHHLSFLPLLINFHRETTDCGPIRHRDLKSPLYHPVLGVLKY